MNANTIAAHEVVWFVLAALAFVPLTLILINFIHIRLDIKERIRGKRYGEASIIRATGQIRRTADRLWLCIVLIIISIRAMLTESPHNTPNSAFAIIVGVLVWTVIVSQTVNAIIDYRENKKVINSILNEDERRNQDAYDDFFRGAD